MSDQDTQPADVERCPYCPEQHDANTFAVYGCPSNEVLPDD